MEFTNLSEQIGDQNREEAEVVARKTQQIEELREQILQLQAKNSALEGSSEGIDIK